MLIGSLTLLLCAPGVEAESYFWDGGAVDIATQGNAASGGGAGTWNTSILNWDPSVSGSAHVAWPNSAADTAIFAGTAGTVSVGGTINVGKLEVRSGAGTGYTFQSGTLNFANGTIDITAGRSATFSGSLMGALTLNSTGNTITNTTGQLATFTGSNTGLTAVTVALDLQASAVFLNHSGALGASAATLKLSKGALTLNNGSTTTYNAWNTEFAGGLLRNRGNNIGNFTNTYTGNGVVTASSEISTLGTNFFMYAGTMDLGQAGNTLTLAPGAAGRITFSNVISNFGNLTIDVGVLDTGTGTVVLGAANTFAGTATTSTNKGTLELNNFNALQNATLNTGSLGGSQNVTFTAGAGTYNIGALQGADDLAIGANTVSIGAKTADTTFSGTITGTAGALTKVGSRSLTLTQVNTYTGPTQVNGGTLLIAGSITPSIATVNNSGSTLGGSGVVGDVSVNSGAVLQGGMGFTLGDALSSSGNVALNDGSIIKLALGAGGGHSSLNRLGGLWSFDSDQAFTFTDLAAETTTYHGLLTGLNGDEAGLASIDSWTIQNPNWVGTFSLHGSEVDLTLVSIPEPGTASLLLGGIALLAGRRRDRVRPMER